MPKFSGDHEQLRSYLSCVVADLIECINYNNFKLLSNLIKGDVMPNLYNANFGNMWKKYLETRFVKDYGLLIEDLANNFNQTKSNAIIVVAVLHWLSSYDESNNKLDPKSFNKLFAAFIGDFVKQIKDLLDDQKLYEITKLALLDKEINSKIALTIFYKSFYEIKKPQEKIMTDIEYSQFFLQFFLQNFCAIATKIVAERDIILEKKFHSLLPIFAKIGIDLKINLDNNIDYLAVSMPMIRDFEFINQQNSEDKIKKLLELINRDEKSDNEKISDKEAQNCPMEIVDIIIDYLPEKNCLSLKTQSKINSIKIEK